MTYAPQTQVRFATNDQFRYRASPSSPEVPFRGLHPLLRDLYWGKYDYYEATRHLAKKISAHNRASLEVCPALEHHGVSGRDVGSIVHQQVEQAVKEGMTAKSLLENTALHPYVRNVFVELGRLGLQCVRAEEIVYDPSIQLATKIDLIARSSRDPNTLVLIEVKVGYPVGSWYASSMVMKRPLHEVGNSPFHQACLQIMWCGEMLRHRLDPGTRIRVATLHVTPSRAILEVPPDNLVKMAMPLYEAGRLRALRNPKLGRRKRKRAQTTTPSRKRRRCPQRAGRGGRRWRGRGRRR